MLLYPDGSYPVSGIQDYFEYTIKKHEKFTDNPPISIFVNKKENRTTFKTYREYYLKLSTSKTMKLLGCTKSKITKNENDEKVFHLEVSISSL